MVTCPTPGIVIVQPCAADPGAASFGVCVCLSVCPRLASKSFRPLNAQIEAWPLVTAAVVFVESPIPPGTGAPWYGGPLISPAKALAAPTLKTAATHAVTASKRLLPILYLPVIEDRGAPIGAPPDHRSQVIRSLNRAASQAQGLGHFA